MNEVDHRSYFFDSGIRFACKKCGHCCTGAPGLIRVSPAEAGAIAAHLKMGIDAFERSCLHTVAGVLSIRERADGSCLFYDGGCSIYPKRPRQCRTYPFWLRNLRTMDRWRETLDECPGIGSGPLFTRSRILARLHEELAHLPDAPQPVSGGSGALSATNVAPQPPADGGAGP